MNTLLLLIKRNVKLFFKDKGMFFSALITPAILLFLYVSFLGNLYRDSFAASLPSLPSITDQMMNGLVGAQLISSLLTVSCVTVAFCTNFLMVQDKANGTIKDLLMSPVKPSVLSMGYYFASFLCTMLICIAAMIISFLYLWAVGWYLSLSDVVSLFLDVGLLVLFGTALSSVIHFFLSTQGQISAVGTIISAGYGFICGAYMPISSYGDGLQKALLFLPGTYGTSLLRNHTVRGVLAQMHDAGTPTQVIDTIKASMDCNPIFFGHEVSIPMMYLILSASILVLIFAYILINYVSIQKQKWRVK